ncbi:MAG: hypothetical protein HC936_14155 [Leptolyngbyaceae cyanobacterium SU_3_3]|nr:hypothetical protein [Leptolyngbyaceae cyanobacterium SU_3_3]
MSDLFEVLEKIQKSPGLYLGRPSVSDLFLFLAGYELARSEQGIELTEAEESFWDEFQPWLQNKLGVSSVTSWAKLIMLSCHDEKEGFELFFRLLDEFTKKSEFYAQKAV